MNRYFIHLIKRDWRWSIFLLLILLTFIFWQWRYVRISPNLVPTDACRTATGWGGNPNSQLVTFSEKGIKITKEKHGSWQSISQPLGDLSQERYLTVTCDVAWGNCERDKRIGWAMPRIVVVGYDHHGHHISSLDHSVVDARGTKHWHRKQATIELPPTMKNARVSIDNFGVGGILQVNNLQVEIVRLRWWARGMLVIISTGWVLWIAMLFYPIFREKWRKLRSVLLGCAIFGAFVIFVFPQPRSLERPLAGVFWLGPVIEPSAVIDLPQAEQSPTPTISQPAPPQPPHSPPSTRVTSPQITPPPPASPVISPSFSPSAPTTFAEQAISQLRAKARLLDQKWKLRNYNLTHFTSFFTFGFISLMIARRAKILIPLLAMALLAEIVPDLIHNVGDKGDLYDLMANISGLLVAWLIFAILTKNFHRGKKPIEAQST